LTATAPAQRQLPLRDARITQRMMVVSSVRDALGVDEGTVGAMIEDGWLGWAWDIATASVVRREVRVLARCVQDVKPFADLYEGSQPVPDVLPQYSAGQVITTIFGAERPWIWGKEFYRAFNCDSGHMINLVLEGTLKRLPRTDWRRGPGGSPAIAWASVVEFVSQRRMPR
jgi:hypothetical protein